MLSFIVPFAFAAVLQNPTPSDQNPSNEEVIISLQDQFLGDTARAYQIAQCESTLTQFRASGDPVESNTHDFGLMQINSDAWDVTAHKLGLDYKHSWRDNIKLAKIVYVQAGDSFSPWTCKKVL